MASNKNAPAYQAHCQQGILLNANECSLTPQKEMLAELADAIASMELNRYPDDSTRRLREEYAALYGLQADNVLVGNGSDQMLQLVITALGDPKQPVITLDPDFGMYDFYASCLRTEIYKLPAGPDGSFALQDLINLTREKNGRLVLFSNPNNPTGHLLPKEQVKELADAIAPVWLVMDEAYMEFAGPQDSAISLLEECSNLLVTRTMSKAWGIAGARVGFLLASPDVIAMLSDWKIVYSLSRLDEAAALCALHHPKQAGAWIEQVQKERTKVLERLAGFSFLEAVPSSANFILVRFDKRLDLAAAFAEEGIQVRTWPGKNQVRLTIGTPKENEQVLAVLEKAERSLANG